MATAAVIHPLIQWAQREKCLYLTVEIDKINELNVTEKSIKVKGHYGDNKTLYEAVVDLYANINPEYRKIDNNRHLELVIQKTEPAWWPRLLEKQIKVPWVKVDFNKWVDEDEEADDGGDMDFSKFMSGYGGDNDEVPNLDDMDSGSEDDDADMPDLEDVKEEDATAKSDHDTKQTDDEPKKVENVGDST